jgi:hypothetical protein
VSGHWRISFNADERRKALVASRRVRNALPETVEVIQGENVLVGGGIYLEVHGERSSIDVACASVNTHGVNVEIAESSAGNLADECINCGNIPDKPFSECPACGFTEISACPFCSAEVPRQMYEAVRGNLCKCPNCGTRVRLRYADPLYDNDGYYVQPVVVVEEAGE